MISSVTGSVPETGELDLRHRSRSLDRCQHRARNYLSRCWLAGIFRRGLLAAPRVLGGPLAGASPFYQGRKRREKGSWVGPVRSSCPSRQRSQALRFVRAFNREMSVFSRLRLRQIASSTGHKTGYTGKNSVSETEAGHGEINSLYFQDRFRIRRFQTYLRRQNFPGGSALPPDVFINPSKQFIW
jgi:hypothetical protein